MRAFSFKNTLLLATAALVGCASVAVVPSVPDPRNVEVNGVAMSQEQFLSRYCRGQSDSNTCVSVVEALAARAAGAASSTH